jgi:predicted aldo/keto reductase-like oxidoreductase
MPNDRSLTRRTFLQLAGAAPLAAALPALPAPTAPAEAPPARVETRPFGATGVNVSKLALGMMFDVKSNVLLLKQALDWGVTHWDTADCYEGGESEEGVGRYFKKFPDDRAKVFLVTKGDDRDAPGLTKLLDRSLSRMRTEYVDLYYLHNVKKPGELTDEMRAWAEAEKKRGRIKLFGFSTHSNMAELLATAAPLAWIDALLVKYSYRLEQDPALHLAIEACGQAGKGLTVMKVLADGPIRREHEEDMRLAGHFLARGFTPEQAMVKAVWQNKWISSACLRMKNTELLTSFVAAALDRTTLSDADWLRLRAHAEATADTFCAGCARLCESAAGGLPVSEALRCLMYTRRDGVSAQARAEYARLPEEARRALALADLRGAEASCPHHLPLSRLVHEADRCLA